VSVSVSVFSVKSVGARCAMSVYRILAHLLP
jgi:hypothetical protein